MKKNQHLEKSEKKPEQIVYSIVSYESKCDQCQNELFKGSFLQKKQDKGVCKECSDFKEHYFLPAGNANLTRRAKQYSKTNAVVVRFSRARKRYERQGILVEEKALRQAVKELGIEIEINDDN